MDFLNVAEVLIPSLTGIPITIYNASYNNLEEFEKKYCFMPDIQVAYSANWLTFFFEEQSEDFIYEIVEPMESRLLVFKIEQNWIVLGPYFEDVWNENRAKCLLAKCGIQDSVMISYKLYRCELPVNERTEVYKIAVLLIENTIGTMSSHEIQIVNLSGVKQYNPNLVFLDKNASIEVINKRYDLENKFIEAISVGDEKRAVEIYFESKKTLHDLRFISNNMTDLIAVAAISRTLIRKGAEKAGLAPIIIDSISQEYAQQMHGTVRSERLVSLMVQLISRFCSVIKKEQKNDFSLYIRKAVQYIDINISNPIAIEEVAKVASISKSYFVRLFKQETGMTVKQYIAKRRCDIAAELLINSSLSVQEISHYVGYIDNNYFAKVFKANIGVSPIDFRKNHMK